MEPKTRVDFGGLVKWLSVNLQMYQKWKHIINMQKDMIISLLIHKSRTVQSDGWSSGVSLRPCRAFYWLQGKMTKIQQKVVIITPLHQYNTINVNLYYIHGRK